MARSCAACERELFRDYATGDAIAGVSGGIGFLVVGFGVDDEGCSSVAEDGVRVVAPGDVFVIAFKVGFAVGSDGEIGAVSGVMAFGILEAVLLAIGIEVRSGRLEVGRLALGVLMEMDRVVAGGKVLDADFHADAGSGVPENGGADDLALRVLELNQNLGGTGRSKGDNEECEGEQAGGFHGGIIASFCGAGEDRGPKGFNHEGPEGSRRGRAFRGKSGHSLVNVGRVDECWVNWGAVRGWG